MTTSGGSASIAVRSESPSANDATSSTPSTAARTSWSASRIRYESSARTTRIGPVRSVPAPADRLPGVRARAMIRPIDGSPCWGLVEITGSSAGPPLNAPLARSGPGQLRPYSTTARLSKPPQRGVRRARAVRLRHRAPAGHRPSPAPRAATHSRRYASGRACRAAVCAAPRRAVMLRTPDDGGRPDVSHRSGESRQSI